MQRAKDGSKAGATLFLNARKNLIHNRYFS